MANPESVISNEILAAIGSEPDLLLFRNTVGVHRVANESDNTVRTLRHGLGVGSPDFVGILNGRWFCLEVKVPGKKPNAEQEKCHAIWRRFGALIYTVSSGAEAKTALVEARGLVGKFTREHM